MCYHAGRCGEVAEWSNVPDSKSGVLQGTVGSNPTLSASNQTNKRLSGRFFVVPIKLSTIQQAFCQKRGVVLPMPGNQVYVGVVPDFSVEQFVVRGVDMLVAQNAH